MEIEVRQSRIRQFGPSEQSGVCPTCGGPLGLVNETNLKDTGSIAALVGTRLLHCEETPDASFEKTFGTP